MCKDEPSTEQDELADRCAEQILILQSQGFAAIPMPRLELCIEAFDVFVLICNWIFRRLADIFFKPLYFAEQDLAPGKGKARRFTSLLKK